MANAAILTLPSLVIVLIVILQSFRRHDRGVKDLIEGKAEEIRSHHNQDLTEAFRRIEALEKNCGMFVGGSPARKED